MHATTHSHRQGNVLFALLSAALLLAALVLFPVATGAQADWRLQILDAAVVRGPVVLLGEIARPVGHMDESAWRELAAIELFPAPAKPLRPMSISGSKLSAALQQYLGERSRYCILPNSLAVQRGGALMEQKELIQAVVNTLTPMAAKLGGEAELRDFRLPDFVFLRDPGNAIRVEMAGSDIKPGRVSLRLREVAMDGSVQRSLTGSVHVDLWQSVPVAARPLNRGEDLNDANTSYLRKNVAFLRGDIWDGSGGPWRMKTALGKDEVIYSADLEPLPLITKGDVVELVYKGTNIRLEVPAEALADGGYKQSIPVRNMQSKVQVYARVVDAQTVQVF